VSLTNSVISRASFESGMLIPSIDVFIVFVVLIFYCGSNISAVAPWPPLL
jgi:hypothetical protein